MKKQPEITDATRTSILDAFWKVYQQKPIDRITVKDISDMAHVHRSTFYRYFTDVYELLNQFEQKILDEISITLEKVHGTQEFDDMLSHAGTMIGAWKGYAPAIYHLTSSNGDSGFGSKLRNQMLQYFSRFSFSSEHSMEAEYLFNFIFTNILANLNFWYDHQKECTLEQIGELSKQLVSEGVTEYIKSMSSFFAER